MLVLKHFEDEKVSNPPEIWLVEVKTNVYFNLVSYNLLKAFGKWKYCSVLTRDPTILNSLPLIHSLG